MDLNQATMPCVAPDSGEAWVSRLYPIRVVRSRFGKTVGLINPQKRPSRMLSGIGDFTRQVARGVLEASQFPDQLEDAEGSFHKPASW